MTRAETGNALFRERTLQWRVGADEVLGILSYPENSLPLRGPGVVIVVGGPQYRAGSHRQFTLLARRMAAAGFAVLRFDTRGMGDSSGHAREFYALDDDIAAAIQAVQAALPQLQQWILWGLCDAASANLLFLQRRPDSPIAGVCLLNPWVRSEQSQARTRVRHYYLRQLQTRSFWTRVLRGKVAVSALFELVRSLRLSRLPAKPQSGGPDQSFQELMLAGLQGFKGPILLILSGEDYTAKEFLEYVSQRPAWQQQLARPNLTRVDLAGADHTFSNDASHVLVERAVLSWIADLAEVDHAQADHLSSSYQ